MITRCPYQSCAHEFEIASVTDATDESRWVRGECPLCRQRASFRPVEIMRQIDKLYDKQVSNGFAGESANHSDGIVFSAILEDVRSLWNVGSMFRTADGAGFGKLHLCGITGCPPRKEIEKTSLGAEKTVAWQYHRSALDAIGILKKQGVTIVGLEMSDKSTLLSDLCAGGTIATSLCLVLGNEVTGVSEEALSQCDFVAHLPMRGVKESLNVAVAFGIASYVLSAKPNGTLAV